MDIGRQQRVITVEPLGSSGPREPEPVPQADSGRRAPHPDRAAGPAVGTARVMPLSELEGRLSAVIDEVAVTHERVTVTRRGRTVAVVISAVDFEAIETTMAILTDWAAAREQREPEGATTGGDREGLDAVADLPAARR